MLALSLLVSSLAFGPSPSAPSAAGVVVPGALLGAFQKYEDEIAACEREAIERRPELSGRLAVRFVVAADGAVTSATVEEPGSDGIQNRDPSFAGCITGAAEQWHFSAPELAETSVVHTFVLGSPPELGSIAPTNRVVPEPTDDRVYTPSNTGNEGLGLRIGGYTMLSIGFILSVGLGALLDEPVIAVPVFGSLISAGGGSLVPVASIFLTLPQVLGITLALIGHGKRRRQRETLAGKLFHGPLRASLRPTRHGLHLTLGATF